ncbi:MAG: cupin domain-containing protein [Prevotella sp.]
MNQTELKKTGQGYQVATVGNLDTFEGKAFVKEIVGATAMEVSFGTLQPGESVPFFHHHRQNEEVYIVLRGTGVFTLDGEETPVASGSVIRIAPEVSRCTRNEGDTPLCYLCIQAKAHSLEQYTMTDGVVEP